MLKFVSDREIYTEVICKLVPSSTKMLWIATADLKDMYVEKQSLSGKKMIPFLQVLSNLLDTGVEVRLIHAKEPGPAFRQDFDKYPALWKNLERVLCPRVHFKCIIADGKTAYFGSANFTGAGMGAKSDGRRNFENGILTDRPELIEPLSAQFDNVWSGLLCKKCGRRKFCTDCPVDK